MGAIRHIFLTGDKKVGKSTLWKNVLKELAIVPSGFLTLAYTVKGNFRGFCLHGLGTLPQGFENDMPISIYLKPRMHRPILDSFEEFGAALLEVSQGDSPYLMMDELGRFEKDAPGFQRAVMDCLEGDCHVLGVLQDTHNDFIDKIRKREDILLIRVTEKNRDALLEEVIRAVKELK